MANVLLDTTVLIDLLRGRQGAIGRLRALRAQGERPYVCAVNVDEVVRGLRPAEEGSARLLLDGFRVVALSEREGWWAGECRRTFASQGKTLSQADCLVAAAVATIGGRLATGNPEDFPMSGIAVEHWPSGEWELGRQELPVQGQVIGDHAVRPEAFGDPSAALTGHSLGRRRVVQCSHEQLTKSDGVAGGA